jgi:hypothetical protein
LPKRCLLQRLVFFKKAPKPPSNRQAPLWEGGFASISLFQDGYEIINDISVAAKNKSIPRSFFFKAYGYFLSEIIIRVFA